MHDHAHDHRLEGDRRALAGALALIAAFTVVEVVVGYTAASLALLADAGHMLGDVGSLALALFAAWLGSRPATPERSFGYRRAEILAALANGVALVLVFVLGLVFIPAGGADAAAWVAVAAESALATFLWVALERMRPAGAPRLWFAWKVALAGGLAGGAAYLLRDSPVVAAAVATVVFAAVAGLTRAVPLDLFHALGFRWGEDEE